jgi:uncharacterized protein YyaL (SSP411 family)
MQSVQRFANQLVHESSPYLLQHAHNPVDWYPWGDEAFAKAKAEDKPVLVSIGYSACHWCHVMEHESFEDEDVAKIQNEHFINIKVDMEERPDVDQIYMNFVQVTTGRGGWPMNVFVTPDKLPFFGGTYFPPSPRYGMPSWQQILISIADAWRERRDELLHSANDILGELRRMSIVEIGTCAIDGSISDLAFESFVRTFDPKNGGWGGAPKFPQAMSMEFLLRYWKRTKNEKALEMVRFTAEKMANGGIYDQLGGGFHRYATDAIWLVPHFEKMLYDNAQLIRIYLHLFQITKDEFFRRVAVETLDYVRREMLDERGGFFSTQDADSEGEEGKFFVWSPNEVEEELGADDAKLFNFFFDISEGGNFEGQSILQKLHTIEEAAQALHVSKDRLTKVVERGRNLLFGKREDRIKPFRDEKILTAWNGLMLSAFAEAAAIFSDEECLDVAKRNAEFLLNNMFDNGKMLRTWKEGKAKLNGYIEDYANLADGLVELYQASGEEKYLARAKELADAMITEFWDEENGGFYFTSNDHEELIVRNKDFYDNATPSGNSVSVDVLLRLSKFYGEEKYERFASTVLRLMASQMKRFPGGFGRALSALEFRFADVKEIVIVGPKGNDLAQFVWSEYRPFKVVATSEAETTSELPLIEGRASVAKKPTAYVCQNFVCQRPVTSVQELNDLISESV